MKFRKKSWLIALLLTLAVCLGLAACNTGELPADTADLTDVTTAEAVTSEPSDETTAEPDAESDTDPEADPDTEPEAPTEPDGTVEEPDETPDSGCPLHPGTDCECIIETATTAEPTDAPTEPDETPSEEPAPDTPAEPEIPALSMPDFKASDVPAYGEAPYVEVNGNIPFFTPNQITADSYEYYSPLDALGRCGTVVASIGRDLMPTEDRGSISSVKPTGWHSVSYPELGIDSLYNRSHLIAFQLTGENANQENLISGTRYMNQTVMTLFENMVADYIKETGNHVLYRITPIFTGNNLIADGVLMEAWSVEDEGDGICFCVYLYNVQPGVEIDYATGDSTVVGIELPEGSADYILNTNTKKFHKPTCSNADSISDKNRQEYFGSREELIAEGYKAAGCCNP